MCFDPLLQGIEIYVHAGQDLRGASWTETLLSLDIANQVAKVARDNSHDPITPRLMQESAGWVSHLRALDRAGKLSFFAGIPLPGPTSSVALTLKQLNLVDTKDVSWEQIHEFRKDTDNVRRLRNLRLDLAVNYEGKDPEFIRDDLERRFEEYREATQLWGFPTFERAMDIVLNDKSTTAFAVATIAGAVLGDGPTATAAALIGATATLGRVVWEVTKRHHSLGNRRRTHALAYLLELENLPATRKPEELAGDAYKALVAKFR